VHLVFAANVRRYLLVDKMLMGEGIHIKAGFLFIKLKLTVAENRSFPNSYIIWIWIFIRANNMI